MGKLKQKTHKGTKKSIMLRNSGSAKFKKPGANHKTVGYSAARMRNLRKGSELSKADSKRLKRLIDRMN